MLDDLSVLGSRQTYLPYAILGERDCFYGKCFTILNNSH